MGTSLHPAMTIKQVADVLCVYCNANPATTMDHVIPKCLFVGPLPADMVTVPVCAHCNNKKSKDDDYLRDLLVIDIENVNHPIAQQLLRGKVLRSAQKNRSQIVRDMRAKSVIRNRYTVAGIYTGTFQAVPLEANRVKHIFARITRGLYYKLYERRFPNDCDFRVSRVAGMHVKDAVEIMHSIGGDVTYLLAEFVFSCMHVWSVEDPTVTSWLQNYYNFVVMVTTNVPESEEPRVESG